MLYVVIVLDIVLGSSLDYNMLISVLIGVYNGAPYLGEAIDSVFAQSYRPIELIVVDDGSTDGSAEIARSFPQVDLIQQENQGPAAARNAGLAAAAGGAWPTSSSGRHYWQDRRYRI